MLNEKKYGPSIREGDLREDDYAFLNLFKEQADILVSSYCKAHAFPQPKIIIHNDSLANLEYRAYSSVDKDIPIIGITVTTVLVIRHYFMCALAHKSKESRPPLVKNLLSLNSYPNVSSLSLNQNQFGFAEHLARIGLIYIVAHELSHLKLGHASYADPKIFKDLSEQTKFKYRQAMELYADICAVGILMRYLLMLEKDNSMDLMQFLHSGLASIGSTFRINWASKNWSQNLYDSTHPPAQYRSLVTANQLLFRFQKERNLSVNKVNQIFKFMTNEIQCFYEDVTGDKERKFHGEEFFNFLNKQEKYTSQLLKHHKVLFPEAVC